MSGRSVAEWVGSTPDATIPPRVRLRLFERAAGCCQSCTRKIRPGDGWDADHIVALVNGGENRERNLQLLCSWCHSAKTRVDVAEKARTARIRQRHIGIKAKSRFACSKNSPLKKKINGRVEPRFPIHDEEAAEVAIAKARPAR